MKSKSVLSVADERDIALVVDKTIERGSMTEDQVLALGVSRESYQRNSAAIAARIRSSEMQFTP